MRVLDVGGNTLPEPQTEHLALTMALWLVIGWFMSWSFFGFAYSAYRVSKYRMFAPDLHPALAPLVELALAARALTVAAQRQGNGSEPATAPQPADCGWPVRKRLRSLWDFRRTQTGRLGLGLLTVAVGTAVAAIVVPA
jgi:hypothetical protein